MHSLLTQSTQWRPSSLRIWSSLTTLCVCLRHQGLRYSYGYTGVVSLFRTQLEGKVLTVTKLPDPRQHLLTMLQSHERTSDQRRLAQLNRLLATCRLGARVTGSASHSVPRVSNGDQLAASLPCSKPEKSNPKPFCAPGISQLPDDAHRQPASGSRSAGPTGRLGPAGTSPGGAGAGGPAGIPSQAPAKSSTPQWKAQWCRCYGFHRQLQLLRS